MAQSVKHPNLGFGSGHDLRVLGLSPVWGSVLSAELACPSSSPLSISKIFYFFKIVWSEGSFLPPLWINAEKGKKEKSML